MGLTNAGRDVMTQCLTNYNSPVFFDNTHSYIGVGDSSTAFIATQTDLQASTNKIRKGMVTSYPTTTSNILVFKSSFGATEGNFTWNEWAVFNALSSGVMLNRKVENLCTKNGGTFNLTVTLTVSIGS